MKYNFASMGEERRVKKGTEQKLGFVPCPDFWTSDIHRIEECKECQKMKAEARDDSLLPS